MSRGASALPRRLLDWSAATLVGWSWRQSAIALLVAAASTVYMDGLSFDAPGLRRGLFLLHTWLCHLLQLGLPLVLAVAVADRAVDDGERPLLPYLLAATLTVFSGFFMHGPALIEGLLQPLLRPLLLTSLSLQDSSQLVDLTGLRIFVAASLIVPVTLGTMIWAHLRRGWRDRQDLRERELEQARATHALASLRLLALQARVEPQLLFDTLERATNLIDHSVAAADALLTDLAALLRLMLPSADATASTLGRELALVQAYGRVTGTPRLLPPQLTLTSPAELASAPLAPMVLLSLVRQLAALEPALPWQLRAQREGDGLCIVVAAPDKPAREAARQLSAVDLRALGEQLRAVHGSSVALREADATTGALTIEIRDPDHAPGPDR